VERPESRSDPWRSGLRQAVPDPWRSGKSEGAQGWQQSSVVITCSEHSLHISNSFDIFCFITCSVACSATLAPSQLQPKSALTTLFPSVSSSFAAACVCLGVTCHTVTCHTSQKSKSKTKQNIGNITLTG
jgi:hypothetical protein